MLQSCIAIGVGKLQIIIAGCFRLIGYSVNFYLFHSTRNHPFNQVTNAKTDKCCSNRGKDGDFPCFKICFIRIYNPEFLLALFAYKRDFYYRVHGYHIRRYFLNSIDEVRALYRDLEKLYDTIISANSIFLSPSETPNSELLKGLLRHPVNEARLLGLLSKNALSIVQKRVKDEKVLEFFNKLTSTYSYTTLEETPALMAATMFVENHVGGSYYPAGSPMMLAAKLEKALEKFGGSIRYRSTATRILVEGGKAVGAALD